MPEIHMTEMFGELCLYLLVIPDWILWRQDQASECICFRIVAKHGATWLWLYVPVLPVRWHLCFYWMKPNLHFGCSQHFKHIFVFELDLLCNNSHYTGFSCTASKTDQRNKCAVWLGNKIPVFYQHCPLLSAATASLCFWMQNSNPTFKIRGKTLQEETNHSFSICHFEWLCITRKCVLITETKELYMKSTNQGRAWLLFIRESGWWYCSPSEVPAVAVIMWCAECGAAGAKPQRQTLEFGHETFISGEVAWSSWVSALNCPRVINTLSTADTSAKHLPRGSLSLPLCVPTSPSPPHSPLLSTPTHSVSGTPQLYWVV